jgi:PhoD related phosphatase/WW domain
MASRQRADDELFFQRNSNGDDSPTIEPLRINKSPEPPRAGSAASGRYNYPPPSRQQSFPLPPGASSSAAPLPYPDDESHSFQYPRPAEPRAYRAPYPEDGQDYIPDRGTPEPPLHSAAGPASRSGSSDQGRPPPSSRKGSFDTASKLGSSPTDKRGPRLAERRGTAPKSLPDSPGPETPDKEGLFAKEPQRPKQNGRRPSHPPIAEVYGQQSISNATGVANVELISPQPMNRFASTASTSTTRASRGSPAPPETPIVGPELPGGGIEARFAAAGIAGAATLSSLQAQNAAAALRLNQYAPPPVPQLPTSPGYLPVRQQQVPRPWTPTESPENQPHGPPTVYQGPNQVAGSRTSPPQPQQKQQNSFGSRGSQPSALEQDFQRMQLSASPPPAYSSVTPEANSTSTTAQGYPNEKQTGASNNAPAAPAASSAATAKPETPQPLASPGLQHQGHPAFANDPIQPSMLSPGVGQGGPVVQFANAATFQSMSPASPPPLPEGWIAHLDQNSGQYYYIHLATQATQWEFPKGPTPLNHSDIPTSPTLSTYGNPLASPAFSAFHGKQGLASPMFPPHTPGYAESILSITSQTSTALGFSGPPPSAGVEMYKIAPTNAVYFGPYLKYINMDLERGIWLGSIMLITDAVQPPTIHIHQSVDLSPNPRQLKANPIHTHQRWVFYRYDIDLQMGDGTGDKWTYAITSHLGCTRYEFLVAGRYETNWRFIAHSGNDFALNTNQTERSRLGGVGYMWKDVLQKNIECGGFHVQLGLGDQIYGDRLWKDIPLLKQWLATSGKENRKNAPWTAVHEEDVTHAFFHYYTSHFDQPFLREAFAQIPHILTIDDHDM